MADLMDFAQGGATHFPSFGAGVVECGVGAADRFGVAGERDRRRGAWWAMSKLLLVESDAAYGALLQAVVEVLGQRAERAASFDEARQVLSGGRWSGVLAT